MREGFTLAYHADAEIVRVWTITGTIGVAVIAVIAVVLSRLLPHGRGGNGWPAAIAFGLASASLALAVTEWFLPVVLVGPLALPFGIWAVVDPEQGGRKLLGLASLVASLLAFDLAVSGFVACGVTDGCFH